MSELLPLLVAETGLSTTDILRIVSNAPRRYKTYPIPKRNGEERIVSQPARELKALQRALVDRYLLQLPVHSAATAYRPGTSIRYNAEAHVHNGPIFKFDFQDFFPSITSHDWAAYCKQYDILTNERDLWISTNILFQQKHKGGRMSLAIGAPSSPHLSNVIMRDFDERISLEVAKDRVTYTRYADDLTFSAKRTGFLNGVEHALRRIVREIKYPSLTINEAKTARATKKYKRFVTGLILTNDQKVSIGRDKKRLIRAGIHHYLSNKLDINAQARLAGLLAFVNDVEPDFLSRLKEKYGAATIDSLKQTPRLKRLQTSLTTID